VFPFLSKTVYIGLVVDGICEGLPAGTMQIQFASGKCRGETLAGEAYMGWNSFINIMIAETYVEREVITFTNYNQDHPPV